MSAGKANCLVCGEPLVYWEEAQEVTCHVCGKTETGHSVCKDGHYVCDACHRAEGVAAALETCLETDSRNPVEILGSIMDLKHIYPNGPEHHTAVGAALLTAYKNAGGELDLEKALAELRKRSMQVPGGTCGFWGTCGAAVSAGQFWSIVSGSTPMKDVAWGECQRLTSRVLGKLADVGGPRCCKRTGYTAILEATAYAEEMHGVKMDIPEQPVCRWFPRNAECLRERCPFFPEGAVHPDDK